MLRFRGINRRSFIAGSSKHNTRIERLWRDVHDQVIEFYMILFESLEDDGLDITNLLHVFALQYMFIPRIQEHLNSFIGDWFQHPISSEQNKTPARLLEDFAHDFPGPVNELNAAGLAELLEEIDEDDNMIDIPVVEVDPLHCPLSNENLFLFKQQIRTLTLNDSTFDLVDRYMNALNYLNILYYGQP